MSEAGSVTVAARSKGLSLRHRLPEQREDITFDPPVMQMGKLNRFW
jgi:hypothetical protein